MSGDEEYLPETIEECEDKISEHEMVIDEIRSRIELYDDGIFDGNKDDDWRRRAIGAIVYNSSEVKNLRRQIRSISKAHGEAKQLKQLRAEVRKLNNDLSNAKATIKERGRMIDACGRAGSSEPKHIEKMKNMRERHDTITEGHEYVMSQVLLCVKKNAPEIYDYTIETKEEAEAVVKSTLLPSQGETT